MKAEQHNSVPQSLKRQVLTQEFLPSAHTLLRKKIYWQSNLEILSFLHCPDRGIVSLYLSPLETNRAALKTQQLPSSICSSSLRATGTFNCIAPVYRTGSLSDPQVIYSQKTPFLFLILFQACGCCTANGGQQPPMSLLVAERKQ